MSIFLGSTSDLLNLVTTGTQTLSVHVSYLDTTSTPPPSGLRENHAISTATTTAIVASPAASTLRNVKFISIHNGDTTAASFSVQHTDGTSVITLVSCALLPGWTLTFNDIDGWLLLDPAGGRNSAPLAGQFLRSSLLTVSGTFTTTGQTNTVFLRGVGGGGGGAGCSSVASAAGAGGGGGAGSYLEKTTAVSPGTGYTFTCGAAGTTGTGAGGAGGSSTFVIGATTYTCHGGSGAAAAVSATTLKAFAGGAGGTVSTNGDLNVTGDPGKPGVTLVPATPTAASGPGGSSPFGGGGVGLTAAGNGASAGGFGAGGGGSLTGALATKTGGTPTGGAWIVMEFA